jgi:hypothetical protein
MAPLYSIVSEIATKLDAKTIIINKKIAKNCHWYQDKDCVSINLT